MSNFFLSFFTSAYNYYSGRLAIVVRTDYPDIQLHGHKLNVSHLHL